VPCRLLTVTVTGYSEVPPEAQFGLQFFSDHSPLADAVGRPQSVHFRRSSTQPASAQVSTMVFGRGTGLPEQS